MAENNSDLVEEKNNINDPKVRAEALADFFVRGGEVEVLEPAGKGVLDFFPAEGSDRPYNI